MRFVYLGYYIRKTNFNLYVKYLNYSSKKYKKPKIQIIIDSIVSVFKYNVSLLEFFQFRYLEKTHKERNQWAGTGFMYEYQKIMNPPHKRIILDDKTKFIKFYNSYMIHLAYTLDVLKNNPDKAKILLNSPKIVLKESKGKCGLGTYFIATEGVKSWELIRKMEEDGYDLAETFVQQHPDLNRLSPSGVNTVRIFTQLDKNSEVVILGSRQRISINSSVDNLAAGNIVASIDESTGKINSQGFYSDITKQPVTEHPITKVTLEGFKVPYWKECLELAKNAANEHPQNRSIGWDIVVTAEGPGLIEGNHDWCKLVWQLPVRKGMKKVLERHLLEYDISKRKKNF